jgi:hypothetical protein
MYTYVTEFNLAIRGDEADEYIMDSVRTWPALWGGIKGVTGTLLLGNAFALGGDFEYQFRVDIESLDTLARIDETVKAGEGGWRKSRKDWFRNRTAVRSHICSHVAGDKQYCQERKGTDGAVHAVISAASPGSKAFAESLNTVRALPGVIAAQMLRPLMGSAESGEKTWLRMDSVKGLGGLAGTGVEVGGIRLFGEIREVAGSLFVGA